MRRRFGVCRDAIACIAKIEFLASSLLPQEPAGLYRRSIGRAATELERFEVAGRCHANRILRRIQAADVVAAMVHCRPHRDISGPQGRGLWGPRPLGASFVGIWGILRPPPAVISSVIWRTARGLSWRGGFSQPGIGVPMAPWGSSIQPTTRCSVCSHRAAACN